MFAYLLYVLRNSSLHDFSISLILQHFGQSPLPAYEPAFDWENERSMIFGQRTPETPTTHYGRFNTLLQSRVSVSSLCIFFCFILFLGWL